MTYTPHPRSGQEREKELQARMDTLREAEAALRSQVQQLMEETGALVKKGRVKNKRIKDLMEEAEQKDKDQASQATEAKTTAKRIGKVRTRRHHTPHACSLPARLHVCAGHL
jgi:predicted  nucleic acid-binding Zn-ribbon protein